MSVNQNYEESKTPHRLPPLVPRDRTPSPANSSRYRVLSSPTTKILTPSPRSLAFLSTLRKFTPIHSSPSNPDSSPRSTSSLSNLSFTPSPRSQGTDQSPRELQALGMSRENSANGRFEPISPLLRCLSTSSEVSISPSPRSEQNGSPQLIIYPPSMVKAASVRLEPFDPEVQQTSEAFCETPDELLDILYICKFAERGYHSQVLTNMGRSLAELETSKAKLEILKSEGVFKLDPLKEIELDYCLAQAYASKGAFDSAIRILDRLRLKCAGHNPDLQALKNHVYSFLVILLIRSHKLDEASSLINEIPSNVLRKQMQLDLLLDSALGFIDLLEYDIAKRCYKNAMIIKRNSRDLVLNPGTKRQICTLLYNHYLEEGKQTNSLEFYEKALDVKEIANLVYSENDIDILYNIATTYLKKAQSLIEENNKLHAEFLFNRVYRLATKHLNYVLDDIAPRILFYLVDSYITIGGNLSGKGNQPESIYYLKKAKMLLTEHKFNIDVTDTLAAVDASITACRNLVISPKK